jgi:hypothetical protein
MTTITAKSKGKDQGDTLRPHRYSGGYFLVTRGRHSNDPDRHVLNEDELLSWVAKGYGIRMSAPGHSPSTFMPRSLIVSER